MKIIGLTGGIGTGKSTVSEYIAKKGIKVIDVDAISHMITEKGTETTENLKKTFGPSVAQEDGTLDRKALAAIAFSSEENKLLLEKITHRAIREEVDRQLRYAAFHKTPVVVIDAPLLIEAHLYGICDSVWVVHADMDVRIKRIMERDGMSREEILARMRYQLEDNMREEYADELIENSGEKEMLYQQLEELIEKYA